MLWVAKWLRWPEAAGSPVEGRLAGRAGGELAPCQAHAGIWRDLSLLKHWDGEGLLSGARGPGGENPKSVLRAGSPPMLCSSLDLTAPGAALYPHLVETLPISPSFSQKLSPACQTQYLESFTLSCQGIVSVLPQTDTGQPRSVLQLTKCLEKTEMMTLR